jgi:MerC mercury resistance protein
MSYICVFMKFTINADMLGMGASITCAIHCAVLPVFVSGLSIFGVNIIHNFWFESGMILLAFVIGIFSLRHGFLRHHRNSLPFLLFTGGMTFLLAKEFWQVFELILLPFALILIISAHYFNYRFTRKFDGRGNKASKMVV